MKNKQKAMEAISKDCQVQYEYYTPGGTCALGCLALLSGVSEDELVRASSENISRCPEIYEPIEAEFGLTVGQQRRIQVLNDQNFEMLDRRDAVLKYLERLEDSP